MNLAALLESIDEAAIDRELAKRGYIHFVQAAWDQVEPAQKFVNSWHVGAVCEHMQAIIDKQITKLIINVPPNTSKSMICTVLFDPYAWTVDPSLKFIHGCFDDKLGRRDSLRAKNLINSLWYQARWGNVVKIDRSVRDAGDEYRTTAGGFRKITTPGGSVTGEHGNIHIIDDPIKPSETMGVKSINQIELSRLIDWWDGTLANRFVDFDSRIRVLIMQRLHEADLSGVLIERGYECLMLPMEFEPERKCYTSIGFEDPRKEPGELLCPERFSQKAVDELFEDMGGRGSQNARAQLQQDPVSLTGDIFKRDKVRYWKKMPEKFDVMCQSWDCTFKKTGTSFVSGQIWGRLGPDYYLLDRLRMRLSFTETCKQVKIMTLRWPKVTKKLVESAANGEAVVDQLKSEISGFELVPVQGGKTARANAISPLWDSGNVLIPWPGNCEWSEEFVNWCVKFPDGKYNDDIDSMSQALSHLQKTSLNKLRAAMKNVAW